MQSYRLYLGAHKKNGMIPIEKVTKLVTQFFEGFTLTAGTGYWKGKPEGTWIIELWQGGPGPVRQLADKLKATFEQESVGLVDPSGNVSFV